MNHHETLRHARAILLGCCGAIGAILMALAAPAPLGAQLTPTNIATFTVGQAAQGKAAYAKSCAACHGADLSGGEFAGSLRGITFSQKWGGKSAEALFTYISSKMPPASPGSLGDSVYAQIVSHILQVNGIQPADTELPTDTKALASMVIPLGATVRAGWFMPYSPLAQPAPAVTIPIHWTASPPSAMKCFKARLPENGCCGGERTMTTASARSRKSTKATSPTSVPSGRGPCRTGRTRPRRWFTTASSSCTVLATACRL